MVDLEVFSSAYLSLIHNSRPDTGAVLTPVPFLYFNTLHIAGDAADLHDELAMRHPEPFQGCNDEFRYDATLLDRVEINIAGYG